MAFDIHVYGIKRGENCLLAHGGHVNDELWDERRGRTLIGSPAKELAPLLKKIDGLDPSLALRSVTEMAKSLSREKRWLLPNLNDIWLACEHWNKLKNHPVHGVLYDTAKVVVVSS